MNIAQRIAQLKNRMDSSVTLVAVSKGQSKEAIIEAHQTGLMDFAENYVQEALLKIKALADLRLIWHFIGPIQSNKTKIIATHFSWAQSITRAEIAKKLNDARPQNLPPLKICIQVNLEASNNKSGLSPKDAIQLVPYLLSLPQLALQGLMTIPEPHDDQTTLYNLYISLHDLLKTINQTHNINLTTLSMGMSHDFITAIDAGSTMVRIGEGIFGARSLL